MSIVVGIDVGGSTTKIVGFKKNGNDLTLVEPQCIHANDPLTATYGAFGKFTDENNISIKDIDRVYMTGVGSSFVKRDIYGLECHRVEEFNCIGNGGLYLSGLNECLVVSMGTGTAIVHAKRGGEMRYLGGTGVGGGTLVGLSKLLTRAENIDHITEFADLGDLSKIDLRISDLTAGGASPLASELTASNFGNVSELATKEDVSLGILNLVYETVGMVSIFASRCCGVRDIVLTGNLTRLDYCKKKFEQFNRLGYGVNFIIPENSEYATVIGGALLDA